MEVEVDNIRYEIDESSRTAKVIHGLYQGEVNIPDCININGEFFSVTSIEGYAFSGCTGLTSITIPDGVTSIGESAFRRCTGLTSVNISASVIFIEESAGDPFKSAFSGCSDLVSIKVDKNNPKYNDGNGSNCIIETETNTLIVGCKTTVIPDSVTSLGMTAFDGCKGLTSIFIPKNVTSIGGVLYSREANESLEFYAFSDCSNFVSIKVDKDNPVFNDGNGSNCIIETATNSLIRGCKATVIPNNVKRIGAGAFEDCAASIIVPDSVTCIDFLAFGDCLGLTSISISNSVTRIEDSVFADCRNLSSITIPDSVKRIEAFAFDNCTSLNSIVIPKSVTYIDEYAFNYCKCDLISLDKKPQKLYGKISPHISVFVPADAVELYKQAWNHNKVLPIETSKYKDLVDK